MNMIGVKYRYYKLENFDFQLDWPWRPKMSTIPGVTIEISEKPKEEAAEDHKKWLETNEKSTENLLLYTDASKLRTQSTDAGIWQVHGNSTTEESWYLGQYMEVFDAELWALWKGLEMAKDHLMKQSNRPPGSLPVETDQLTKNIYLFSDGQSALARIDNLAPRPGQALIHEIYQSVQRITRIYKVNIQFK